MRIPLGCTIKPKLGLSAKNYGRAVVETETKAGAGLKAGVKDYRLTYYTHPLYTYH